MTVKPVDVKLSINTSLTAGIASFDGMVRGQNVDRMAALA
jgi:hypothetical protein